MLLAKENTTAYRIIISHAADEATNYAARELSRLLFEISGATFPILTDAENPAENELWVGRGRRTLSLPLDWGVCQNEGYYVKAFDSSLLLAGNTGRANLYAVYDFLEESFGCRWFTADTSKIPRIETLDPPGPDRQFTPALEYRLTSFAEARDGDWAARNRLNGQSPNLEARHGGKVTYKGYVHTFANLMPPSEYFDEHPEYYSEIGGKRQSGGGDPQHTQLCLSNPEVLRLVTKKVLSWIAESPEAGIVSVSQNDSVTPCRCESCRRIDEEEGSFPGTLLRFVNAVAEEVEKHYPNVAVDTLAYRYTRRPPKITRPRGNVIIRLCSIECCFTHPIGTCADVDPAASPIPGQPARSFTEDLAGWGEICDRIYIWDYLIDFPFSLLPYPNLEVIPPNIRYFIKNHARGIYEQGGGHTLVSYASELKAYLAARCLWNPDCDVLSETAGFMDAVYGGAAGVMGRIYDAYRREVLADGIHLGFDIHIDRLYNRPGFLESLEELYDEAERLSGGGAALRQVKKARLWQHFAVLIKNRDFRDPSAHAEIDVFAADCKAFGVTRFDETHDMDVWIARWKRSRFDD